MPSKSKSFTKSASVQKNSNPFQDKWVKSNQTLIRKRTERAALARRSGQNVFRDGRIGENDPTLNDENRYLYRLQRERTKRVRKRARFSLVDDETADRETPEEQLEFPSLPDSNCDLISDEDHQDSGDESDERDDFIRLKQTDEEGEDRSERTRQEIMDEVVQKSKMYKAQRQHEKYVTDEQTAKLDQDLPELIKMLAESGAEYEKHQPRPVLSLKQNAAAKPIFDVGSLNPVPGQSNPSFHYDDVYQQLVNEKRARPTQRLLTEEEKAEKERDRLIELENERKSRMESLNDSDEDAEGYDDDQVERRTKRKRERAGDDLDDDFDIPEASETSASEDGEDASETEGESNNPTDLAKTTAVEELKETPASFWDAISVDSFVPIDNESGEENEIAYLFKKCPTTSVELQKVLTGLTTPQRSIVLDRIQTCFAESLNPARNRPKLQMFVSCILVRIERMAELDSDRIGAGIKEINMMLLHLHKLGKRFETTISAWSRKQMLQMFYKLKSASGLLSCVWKASDVILARAIGRLYPSSDLRHPISTPLALLLSEAISMVRIQSLADVALGIFVVNVLLEVVAGKEGYSGELGRFVFEVLEALSAKPKSHEQGKLHHLFTSLDERVGNTNACLSMKDVVRMQTEHEIVGKAPLQRKVAFAILGVTEAMNFSGQHRHWDIVLSGLPIEKVPRAEIRECLSRLVSQSRDSRAPLSLYTGCSRKSIVKVRNPKYNSESGVYRKRPKTSFQANQHGDVSASAKRVKRALRKEERGLTRDVRREAQVLASSRAHEHRLKDEDRDQRHREVMSFFENQQATWKAATKRQKKLSGKRW